MPLAPEFAALLAEAAKNPGPPINELSIGDARALYRAMRPRDETIAVAAVSEHTIDGPGGPLKLRVYTPDGPGPFGTLINYHGGGWVIGDLDTADTVSRNLCRTVNSVVVSVDYRLAPEAPFPAAVDDAYAALSWAAGERQALNGNGRLAVTGESAGGNLAAVVCLMARDQGGPSIDYQLLFYPVVDTDLERPSYRENAEGYMLEKRGMSWFFDAYCPPAQRNDWRLAPLKAGSLAGLPPALVATAEFDPLRDEGNAYAAALEAAGGSARSLCFDGLVHDFAGTAHVFECSRSAFEESCAELKQSLAG